MNNSLTVYKASAGSGKTFTLAVEYIEMLVHDPTSYRRILAVTFTNKATAEMKSRILSQLYGLANSLPSSKAYMDVLLERNHDLNVDLIRERASESLKAIVHDYSRFRIETIDSFFQRVMKQLAHELKLSASFNIELDSVKALEEAVDVMLEKLNNDKQLMNVILSYIEEQMQNDKNWKIQSGIKKFARHIFDESYARTTSRPSYQTINNYKNTLAAIRDNASDKLKSYAIQYRNILSSYGLSIDDFKRKKTGPCSFFEKIEKGKYLSKDFSSNSYSEAKKSPEAWYNTNSSATIQNAAEELHKLINIADTERIKSENIINTVNLAIKDLNNLSLLEHISVTLLGLNEKHNRFLLSDTNNLLREMIGKDDPSFIYEKIGTSIEHIMIDEFQDTSSMQWENFCKLLKEGLAQGKRSLIVGDVKQSIYRWRGGDWNILNSRLESDIYPYGFNEKTLDTNRRSAGNIITFNNRLFPEIVSFFNNDELNRAYSDVVQKIPRNRPEDEGYVKVMRLKEDSENEDYTTATLNALAGDVRDLLDNGLPMEEICILVRTKAIMQDIAKYFAENLPDVSLVSEEAFRLDSSEAITTIIAALKYIDTRDDSVSRMQIALFCNNGKVGQNEIYINANTRPDEFESKYIPAEFIKRYDELHSMPLYELVENLMRIFDIYGRKEEQAYICFFLDELKKFMADQSADIESFLNFWDENLSTATIPGGTVNGIRIMTIHKSKGLQSHTILLPFCDWKIIENGMKAPLVWCRPPKGYEAQDIDILPVTYKNEMENSEFREEYNTEKTQMTVDNINLLYVALTRAEKNLMVYMKDRTGLSTVGECIMNALSGNSFGEQFTDGSNVWEFGKRIYGINAKGKEGGDNPLTVTPDEIEINMRHTTPKVEFRQSNLSARFQQGEDTEQQTYINKGVLMHRLFSTLTTGTEQEIDTALLAMEFEGLITDKKEKESMKKLAVNRINGIKDMGWFDKGNKLYNECKLLFRNGEEELEQAQPDRVIVSGDTVTVVDFKFGRQKDEYNGQVKKYMTLLEHSRFGDRNGKDLNIKGYIWYVYDNKVTEVI